MSNEVKDSPRQKGVPTTEPAKRIADLFHRKHATAWSEKEVRAYKELVKAGMFNDLTDLTLVERWYLHERGKGKDGIQRRDLPTFLNNFRGELDKARLWFSEKNKRPVQKPKTIPTDREVLIDVPANEEEFEGMRERVRAQMEELRKKLNPQLTTEAASGNDLGKDEATDRE